MERSRTLISLGDIRRRDSASPRPGDRAVILHRGDESQEEAIHDRINVVQSDFNNSAGLYHLGRADPRPDRQRYSKAGLDRGDVRAVGEYGASSVGSQILAVMIHTGC